MKLIVANWKMHGSPRQLEEWLPAVTAHAATRQVGVVLCPSSVLIPVAAALPHTPVSLGGQDCHAEAQGPHTGDISAAMLKEAGCAYVIVGHSERRADHGETDAQVRAKAARALEVGLTPIICIGETLDEREASKAETRVEAQLRGSVPEGVDPHHYIIAYEPVWAIGTGKTPSSADIIVMHAHISRFVGSGARILYGGSVKAANARDIMGLQYVSGALVGGASLSASEFSAILDSASLSGDKQASYI